MISLLINLADSLLHHVNLLQQLSMQSTPEAEQIATHLYKVFELIHSLVSPEPQENQNSLAENSRKASDISDLEEQPSTSSLLRTISKLLPVLLQGMSHTTQAGQSQFPGGAIIYRFVETYSAILHQVCHLASRTKVPTTPISTTFNPCGSLQREQLVQSQTNGTVIIPSTTHSDHLLGLCDLAVAMTMALRCKNPSEARMLEGCLSHLITMIGSGLRTSIFGSSNLDHSDSNSVAGDNEPSYSPTQNPEHDLLRQADRLLSAQAPYLIYILARTPTNLPSITNPSTTSHSSHAIPPPAPHPQTPSSVLLNLTRRKMQNTLLTAVFPDNALCLMKQQQQSQTLQQPEEPQSTTALRQFEERDDLVSGVMEMRDWFKSEVFRLVGWDALDEYLRVSI